MATAIEVRDEAQRASQDLAGIANRVNKLITDSAALARQDPLPMQFVGIIHNYRYGNGDSATADGMPSHRFEIESDAGLWLFSSVGSERFDQFVKDSGLGLLSPDALEDRLVFVQRDPEYGRVIPIKLVEGELLGRDARGYLIYSGCIAGVSGGSDQAYKITGKSDNAGEVTVIRLSDDAIRSILLSQIVRTEL